MLLSGDSIGPYSLVRTLGRGSFGEVWLAERRSSLLTTEVALKLRLDSGTDLEVIRSEADVWLGASGHPNVVPVLEAEVYDGHVVIASEYISGGSLSEWLSLQGGKAPSVESAVTIASAVLAGLEHLHRNNLIHRDLKSDNVLLQSSVPRLTDFGLTTAVKPDARTTSVAGTPGYMAPEAFQGRYSVASDIWAAGILLHELLTGLLPFPQTDLYSILLAVTSEAPVPLSEGIPELLRSVLAKALARAPADRFESAAEMAKALNHAVSPGESRTVVTPRGVTCNIPIRTTTFVGRERELAEVNALLSTTRLLTLTGSGGTGKTSLLHRVGTEAAKGDEYPDGVRLLELAPLGDPALVPTALASLLGVREQPGIPLDKTLCESLQSRTLLLLLDNCEHLLVAVSSLADTLIKQCPNVRIMASSREALGVPGERCYRIPSLGVPVPTTAGRSLPIETIATTESVRLFLDRAALVSPEFALTETNADTVARICYRLDGIPLALELAAARLRAISVEQIESRLSDRFRLLIGGSRTALPRHQTLRALIDWSYDLLNMPEKRLMCRLSVFVGGWTLEAAEQVCVGDGVEEWEILDLLAALVDKCLVTYEARAGKSRYRFMETVRQYARDRQAEAGPDSALLQRHRDWFLTLASDAAERLGGPEQAGLLEVLETEHDNLRQALAFCLEEPGEVEEGLRLAAVMQRFWATRSHFSEAHDRFAALLAHPDAQERRKPRADALHGAAVMAAGLGDFRPAESLYQESIEIKREIADRKGIAASLNNLGIVAYNQGNYEYAKPILDEALELHRALGFTPGIIAALNNLANIAWSQGEFDKAMSLHGECLEMRRSLGDRLGVAGSLTNLANVVKDCGDYARARQLQEEALEIMREMGDRRETASLLNNLATVASAQGDYSRSTALNEESLAIRRELGEKHGIAMSLENVANDASALGRQDRARSLLEESLAIRSELGDRQGVATCLTNLAAIALTEDSTGQARSLQIRSLEIARQLGDKLRIAHALRGIGRISFREGDSEEARTHYEEALTLCREVGDRQGIAGLLESFAALAATVREEERAARLGGASQALREAIGAPLAPGERCEYDRMVAMSRDRLEDSTFSVAWSDGRSLTWEQAVAYALEEMP